MTFSKIVRYILGSVACLLALLAVVLIADSGWSNYTYLTQPPSQGVTQAIVKTCHKVQRSTRDLATRTDASLEKANYSDSAVAAWLAKALPNVMIFDYSNVQGNLMNAEKYFTPDGWCNFIDALVDANIVDATITRKLDVAIASHGSPKVVASGVTDHVYTWTVETPVSFSFNTHEPGTVAPQDINNETLVVRIARSSSTSNPDGIGISQWVTVNAKAANSEPQADR